MKRGEVWWAFLPEPIGSEPGYRRPVLIVQADTFTGSAIKTVVCAALTANLRLADAPGNVPVSARAAGLPRPSVVNVSQLSTLDKSFLTQRTKTLSASVMSQVDNGLRLVLNL